MKILKAILEEIIATTVHTTSNPQIVNISTQALSNNSQGFSPVCFLNAVEKCEMEE